MTAKRDKRWNRLSRWIRERERYYRIEAARNTAPFYAALAARSETFKSVLFVMQNETRKHRRENK